MYLLSYVENGVIGKTISLGYYLSDNSIEDFQKTIKDKFSIELSYAQVEELTNDEILILKPMSVEKGLIINAGITLQIIQIEYK